MTLINVSTLGRFVLYSVLLHDEPETLAAFIPPTRSLVVSPGLAVLSQIEILQRFGESAKASPGY
jgi:hypothetical protein